MTTALKESSPTMTLWLCTLVLLQGRHKRSPQQAWEEQVGSALTVSTHHQHHLHSDLITNVSFFLKLGSSTICLSGEPTWRSVLRPWRKTSLTLRRRRPLTWVSLEVHWDISRWAFQEGLNIGCSAIAACQLLWESLFNPMRFIID